MKNRISLLFLMIALITLSGQTSESEILTNEPLCHVSAEVIRVGEQHEFVDLQIIEAEPIGEKGTCRYTKVSHVFQADRGSDLSYVKKNYIVTADISYSVTTKRNNPEEYLNWTPIKVRDGHKTADFPSYYHLKTSTTPLNRPVFTCLCFD